jgi:DNA-3-methyladenine glycosylase II
MAPTFSCLIPLPKNFHSDDFLAFHQRDTRQVAERVEPATLHKGLVWDGYPACLSIRFTTDGAAVQLAVDGVPGNASQEQLQRMAHRMLGLTQHVEEFEQAYRNHAQLGPLLARKPGLRVPLAASPFEALVWAITGQQISVSAAISIRRRLIQACGLLHSGGLHCFPDAVRIAALSEEGLRSAGFSQTKARTLLALSEGVEHNRLPLEQWLEAPPVDEIRVRLQEIKGIGPWTINYALLRGFGWLDGSLHGDVAVRRNLQVLLNRPLKPDQAETQRWLAQHSPWRALVAAHLWAMQA